MLCNETALLLELLLFVLPGVPLLSVYFIHCLILCQVPAFIMSRVRRQYQIECECSAENRPVGKTYCQIRCSDLIINLKRLEDESELPSMLLFIKTLLSCIMCKLILCCILHFVWFAA